MLRLSCTAVVMLPCCGDVAVLWLCCVCCDCIAVLWLCCSAAHHLLQRSSPLCCSLADASQQVKGVLCVTQLPRCSALPNATSCCCCASRLSHGYLHSICLRVNSSSMTRFKGSSAGVTADITQEQTLLWHYSAMTTCPVCHVSPPMTYSKSAWGFVNQGQTSY